MKYKIGDKVRVRKDLRLGRYLGENDSHNSVVSEMMDFAGKDVTITDVRSYCSQYEIEDCVYGWTTDMFEGLVEEVKTETKVDEGKIIINKPAVICIIDKDGKRFKGVAKQMENDVWDEKKGIEIAKKKAQIKLLQYELKQLSK